MSGRPSSPNPSRDAFRPPAPPMNEPSAPAETQMPPASAAPPSPAVGTRRFLDETVRLFASSFKADRAALFLYENETNTLTLRAAFGYPMFGKATIVVKLGEGLAGRALAERRPIYSEMASSMRGYVAHPNFPDEDVQTFLGIPLLCGRERVGVLTLRRRTGHPFLADEISRARLRAASLATSIQNAGALLLAGNAGSAGATGPGSLVPTEQLVFRGEAVSNGWAMGPVRVASDFIGIFEGSDNDYLREKARDVEDLALRLLEALTSADPWEADASRAASIVVAEKLLPSDVLRIARDQAAGIVQCAGGATAHVTLLVRSLRIPMLIVKSRDPLRLPDGERAILDCANESLYVHPEANLVRRFENRARDEAADRRLAVTTSEHTATRDGVAVALEANINILSDLEAAAEAKAAGVGLYRTEFPYLMRQSLPGEDDQLAIYERVLRGMPEHPVTFRTLDAGGDKVLPYLYRTAEDNPALGLRSIRFSLKYPYVLDQQLRAILRAIQNTGRDDVSIMFPMISSVEEFRAAREHVETCLAALHTELGDRPIHDPYIGTMVELPAAVGILDALAEECDFFSIGTNDLIQYMLAVDRTNAAVAANYVPHHPAVLLALRLIARAAERHSIPCAVCGEMGRDPRYLPFLIGLGIRTFSLEPTQIPKTRELIARLTVPQCRAYAERLLSLSTIAEIESAIDDFSRSTFG